jgi:hypothetical protein
MITAAEKGRHLVFTIGDEEDSIAIRVPPLPHKEGGELFALWVEVKFESQEPEDATALGTALAKKALGDAFDDLDVLRSAESNVVANAAILWNIGGGGIEFVDEYLANGLEAAHEKYLKDTGLYAMYAVQKASFEAMTADLMAGLTAPPQTADSPSE